MVTTDNFCLGKTRPQMALGEERSRTMKSLDGAEGQVKKNKRSCEAEALRLSRGGGLSDS